MAKQSNGKNFLIGTVVGGVVGAVTALLFAPKSGRELRADIAEQAQVIGEKTQEVAKSVGAQTSEWVGKAKEAASAVASRVEAWKESRSGQEPSEEEVDALEERETGQPVAKEERELIEVK
jgi:gas vesicle protein